MILRFNVEKILNNKCVTKAILMNSVAHIPLIQIINVVNLVNIGPNIYIIVSW